MSGCAADRVLENIGCQLSQFCERRRAEAALGASEEQFRKLVRALPAAVYTTDRTGRITLFNEHAAELWGRRPELGSDRWCRFVEIVSAGRHAIAPEESPMAVALRDGRGVRGGEEIIIERPTVRDLTSWPIPNRFAAPREKSSGRSICWWT